MVIKLPLHQDFYYEKQHAKNENYRIETIRKYPALRGNMPKVFDYDETTAVICMRYYPAQGKRYSYRVVDAFGNLVSRLVVKMTGLEMGDIQSGNIRVQNYEIIFIDMGL